MVQSTLDSTAKQNAALAGNFHGVLAMLLFAAGFPAAGILLESWGPMALIAVRVCLACALLLPLWLMMDGGAKVVRAPWIKGLLIGGLGFGTGTILLLVTQDLTNAVTAALVAATMPVSAVALEVLLDNRRLTRNFLLGLSLVLLGGFLATGASLEGTSIGIGMALGAIASLFFAWGSRQTVKALPGMSTIGQTTLTLIGAMIMCLIAYGVAQGMGLPGTHVGLLDQSGWTNLLIYAWASMAISQLFWILAVGKLGIGEASFHLNAVPFYVMLILMTMGGDWNWGQALGAAVLAAGVIIAQRRKSIL